MKLYVATSWKNEKYKPVVECLKLYGHQVWNWRNPPTGGNGFSWNQADIGLGINPEECTTEELLAIYKHPAAEAGFASDMSGLFWCEGVVLLLPCGNSAHMEAGYARGCGKPLYILRPTATKADLMHMMALHIVDNLDGLLNLLARK